MVVRGIRGATTVDTNEETLILQATTELIQSIAVRNQLVAEDIAAIYITATHDLNATFPARAIRYIDGWDMVPLICSQEIDVPGSLPLCIRLMIMVNTSKSQADMIHVYLHDAVKLRPDLADSTPC